MTFEYAGDTYTLPDGLEGVTVQQYAQWTSTHGAGLRDSIAAAAAIADEQEKKMRLALVNIDLLTKALSFFSSPALSLEEVQLNIDIRQVISYVSATELPIAINSYPVTIEDSYEWGEYTWYLNAPAEADLSDYNSFLLLQDLAQKTLQLKSGDWNGMSMLLAAYLRLNGEVSPDPANIVVGSEREVMMRDLPLSIALPFAYFIIGTMDIFLTNLEAYASS